MGVHYLTGICMADFHHHRWQKYFGGGFHAANIYFSTFIFWSQTTNLPTPLGTKHDGEGLLEGWLEKFPILGLRCHSPNPLCSRIIFEAKSTLIIKNNIIAELSWPFSESRCLLKTICTVLYRNVRLPFLLKL